jgi:isobutyryl-CoA mutase
MHYEMLKDTDELPIISVNTFSNPNVNAVRVCSLGQITNALFEVGGQYRRNM